MYETQGNYAAQSIGQANAMTNAIKPPVERTALQEIAMKLCDLQGTCTLVSQRLQTIVDRAFGPTPEKNPQGGPTPVPNGVLAEIAGRFEEIQRTLNEQTRLLDRINSIV